MQRTGIFALSATGIIAIAGAALALNPAGLKSGVAKGGVLSAFEPTHVTGADKNTQTCPVCKYPTNPAVQVWVNTDDEKNVEATVTALEKAAKANADKKFKAFVVFVNPQKQPGSAMKAHLQEIAAKTKIANVSLVYLPGPDAEPVSNYEINTDAQVKNTVFVYRNRRVDSKFVNWVADSKGVDALNAAVKNVVK